VGGYLPLLGRWSLAASARVAASRCFRVHLAATVRDHGADLTLADAGTLVAMGVHDGGTEGPAALAAAPEWPRQLLGCARLAPM
jgi:hypothetical protein